MNRMPNPKCFGPFFVAIALGGCQGDGIDRDAFAVRDSIGITIAENRVPAWTEETRWTIEGQPFLSIAGDREAPDYQLFRVASAVRTDDGTIVVADGGSRTVRWYGANGAHLSTAGGPGDGPGEFRALSGFGVLRGDSLYAWDNQAGRISVFFDGAFARDYRPRIPDSWGSLLVSGSLGDGLLAAMPVALPTGETIAGVHRPLAPVWIILPHGEIAGELGEFPTTAVEYRAAATPGAVIRGLVPFGPNTLVGAGADRIVVGDNAAYELRVYDPEGILTRIIRVRESPDPVRAEDLEMELERRLEAAPPVEEIRAGIRANFEATPVPETKPYYDRLLVDSEGYLWVRREAATPTIGARWDIIAPDGRLMGSLRTPPALQVAQVGSDFVLGIWIDDYGVEDVRAFRLIRSPSITGSTEN